MKLLVWSKGRNEGQDSRDAASRYMEATGWVGGFRGAVNGHGQRVGGCRALWLWSAGWDSVHRQPGGVCEHRASFPLYRRHSSLPSMLEPTLST